jgi:hypothetical protein
MHASLRLPGRRLHRAEQVDLRSSTSGTASRFAVMRIEDVAPMHTHALGGSLTRDSCNVAVFLQWLLRPGAATSPDRLFCHVYGHGKGQAQMILGWPYSAIAARPLADDLRRP